MDSGVISILMDGIEESDIADDGVLREDENIATQTGNAWGELVNTAEAECGEAPRSFSVAIEVSLEARANCG